jgi:hypothetical protein
MGPQHTAHVLRNGTAEEREALAAKLDEQASAQADSDALRVDGMTVSEAVAAGKYKGDVRERFHKIGRELHKAEGVRDVKGYQSVRKKQ